MDGKDSTTQYEARRSAEAGSSVAEAAAKQAKRIEELDGELKELRKKNPTQRLDEAYSVKAEEKRREDALQDAKPKKKKPKSIRRGRISTAEKLAMATQEEHICPAGYSLEKCTFRSSRVAWRIINGQAVLVAYHIYAGPDGCVPQAPGVLGRGEFGTEIITSLGLYPVVGTDRYELASPIWSRAELAVGPMPLVIIADNAAPDHIYLRRVLLNGQTVTGTQLRHSQLVSGGELRFEMSGDAPELGAAFQSRLSLQGCESMVLIRRTDDSLVANYNNSQSQVVRTVCRMKTKLG